MILQLDLYHKEWFNRGHYITNPNNTLLLLKGENLSDLPYICIASSPPKKWVPFNDPGFFPSSFYHQLSDARL